MYHVYKYQQVMFTNINIACVSCLQISMYHVYHVYKYQHIMCIMLTIINIYVSCQQISTYHVYYICKYQHIICSIFKNLNTSCLQYQHIMYIMLTNINISYIYIMQISTYHTCTSCLQISTCVYHAFKCHVCPAYESITTLKTLVNFRKRLNPLVADVFFATL